MKFAAMIAVLGGLTGIGWTAERICVYVEWNNAAPEIVARAEQVSARMFASAGVAVEWRSGVPRAGDAVPGDRVIVIEFERATAPSQHRDVLAYAKPYEGVHIVVLYDRI